MTKNNPLNEITLLGQSLWLDYIQKSALENGEIQTLIDEDSISGLTSNPAIFEKAIVNSNEYDGTIRLNSNKDAAKIYETLVVNDIRAAADLLQPVYRDSKQHDGYISLEVSPHLARDAEGTITRAKELQTLVDRDNLMIKVPATVEALPAIRSLTAAGLNLNITLLFSVQRYRDVLDAYMSGLEDRVKAKQSIENIHSVASFFLSRIDAKVDPLLGSDSPLYGNIGIALARTAYAHYSSITSDSRWQSISDQSGNTQRLLWASTSTKDPSFSPVKYVEALIGPDTVNTLPMKTLKAYREDGQPAVRVNDDNPQELLSQLSGLKIDAEKIADQLEQEGLKKFVAPYDRLLETIKERSQSFAN